MNLNAIQRNYHQLTPAERFAAIAAALARGDQSEAERLAAASPLEAGHLPDYVRLGVALLFLAGQHLEVQLDTVARYWRAVAAAQHKPGDRQRVEGCHRMAVELAMDFAVQERVFAFVCERHGVDSADLLAGHSLCGSQLLDEMRATAADLASNPEERRGWFPDAEPMTVEELARPMLNFVATVTA